MVFFFVFFKTGGGALKHEYELGGGTKTKNQSSLSIFDIFWALNPKIVVVSAENQYLGRYEGVMTS